jgi:UDP-galactopyranose mutase
MREYDYLIVGAGFYGSIWANELTKAGYKCLVVDKRKHIGGNCYTQDEDGIPVHVYGAHIFHTKNEKIWNWITQFAEFNNYTNRVKVNFNNTIYSFPINLFTLHQLWGVTTPAEAEEALEKVRIKFDEKPDNLRDWLLSQVGEEIYKIFVEGYTQKQWNRDPATLPASIIKRLPIRLEYNDNYFNDRFQGIPVGGYTQIFEKLLDGIDLKLGVDYIEDRVELDKLADKTLFTGGLDDFYDHEFGRLDYRSLKFDNERLEIASFQGNAVINYTSPDVPFTRILEHKWFDLDRNKTQHTIITREYPADYIHGENEKYYPINDSANNSLYQKYKEKADAEKRYLFGGRLADYRYYDMTDVVAVALRDVEAELKRANA